MDIISKTEDEGGTALFDCGWDETEAIELLIEEGGLCSWEETRKKKKNMENVLIRILFAHYSFSISLATLGEE